MASVQKETGTEKKKKGNRDQGPAKILQNEELRMGVVVLTDQKSRLCSDACKRGGRSHEGKWSCRTKEAESTMVTQA